MLVVPSNREACLKEFLKNWPDSDPIVIEDGPQKTFDIKVKHHYSWAEIDADLGDKAWIISRQDGSVRCYGFLVAYRLGAKIIYTVDDDCYPIAEEEDFFKGHDNKIEKCPAWGGTVMRVRTRGVPYNNLGINKNVVANIGLWTGNADIDSIESLWAMAVNSKTSHFDPPHSDRLLPYGQYFPISSMNLAFKREVAVLAYFPLSGMNSPYRRFDDIWFGIIFKKICDHLRLSIAVGHPYVHHIRASDPFVNLVKEAPGIQFNETFWEIIDGLKLEGTTPKYCMYEVGHQLAFNKNEYMTKLGKAIITWTELFE